MARAPKEADLAKGLARPLIDTAAEDPGLHWAPLGGAAPVAAAPVRGSSMIPLVAGLRTRGQLMVAAAASRAASRSVHREPGLHGVR